MDRTDLSLLLSALCAVDIFVGKSAALIVAAFLAGMLVQERRRDRAAGKSGIGEVDARPRRSVRGQ